MHTVTAMEHIDHEGRVPVYRQLAQILRAQIISGELPPDRALPAKKTLQQRYEVSQYTVERALGVLRDEGLVETVIGRGIYVLPPGERPGQG